MLEGIFFLLISVLMLVYQPFAGSLLIPGAIRISIFVVLNILFIALSIKKKGIFYFICAFIPISFLLVGIWYTSSPQSLPDIFYFLTFIVFAVSLHISMRRIPMLGFLLTKFLFFLVIGISVLAIVSFIAFNFGLLSYRKVNLGGFAYYNYYYNPLVGYIDPREYDRGVIGRVAGFMFEPSFMGWFLTTNLFLISKYTGKNGLGTVICKIIVFLGVISTFSMGAIAVLGAVFSLNIGFKFLRKIGLGEKVVNIVAWIFLIGLPLAYLLLPKDNIGESVGSSSLGDREERMQTSLIILATSGVKDLVFGHSPGYIEKMGFEKGESNQYMKLLVEEGILIFLVVMGFIIYCTKENRNYLLASLIFLNSVIIIWTPLFVVNVLVCRWLYASSGKNEVNKHTWVNI